jgi:predicted GTPase
MVKDMPGTTRDSIDTKFNYNEQNFVLIDTA